MGLRGATVSLLLVLVGGCSGSGSTSRGGTGGGGHAFSCGTTTCNSATQYCTIVLGGVRLPDASSTPVGACGAFDGGAACPSGTSTASPGQCGCYQSQAGEITVTECVP